MCNHLWRKVNDVYLCCKCGLTKMPTGVLIFDKEYPNLKNRKKAKNEKHNR